MKYSIVIAALLGNALAQTGTESGDTGTGSGDTGSEVTEPAFVIDEELEKKIAEKHAGCSNIMMEEAYDNKIKTTSQIEVAKNLITTSEALLKEAIAALPAKKKELEDFEAGLESQPLVDASKAYDDALVALEVPRQSHAAWKEMAEARMENLTAAFKTYDSYKQLLEAQKNNLEQFETRRPVLIAKDEIQSTPETVSDLAISEYNIQKAKDTISKLTQEVVINKSRYEEAGRIYQDADKERAQAEQELAVANQALEDATKKLTELGTGEFLESATQLKVLQLAVKEAEERIEVLKRDNSFAYLQEEVSKVNKDAAIAAFAIAEENCETFGGDGDPVALAQKIIDERIATAKEVAILDAEDDRIAAAIVDGESDFSCAEVREYNGVVLTRPVRPQCNPGFCCGYGVASDGVNYETCQPINASKVVYRPMRAKNATSRKPSETLDFECIEGAKKIALSFVAFASLIFMME